MEIGAVVERVEHLAGVDADGAAPAEVLTAALVSARELMGWVEARQASLVARLSTLVSFPEAAIAMASKTSVGQAVKTKERSDTLGRVPTLADRLGDGAITAAHVDVLTRCSKQLDADRRGELFDRVDRLGAVAAAATVDEFRRRVELEARKLRADDGRDRLEEQRRATRVRTWVDVEGMWNLAGRFDPVTGVRLAAKLDATMEAVFAEQSPIGCPDDPIEKQRFLAAHSLIRLIDGAGGSARPGRADFVVVIDADAPDQQGPVAMWPIPVEIPTRVLADLIGDRDVSSVVVRNGVVLHAPGVLDLGRSTRLANRAQRRASRALYSSCAIPGCSVGFDRCQSHHIIWWCDGGLTDVDNLIPICTTHHGRIHNDGWVITVGPNRELTLRLPDGSIRTTGPPTIRAS